MATSIGGTMLSNRANKRAYDRNNAYNHPSMQMARLKDAGLNPHLVYGGGVQGASGSSSSPQDVEKYEPRSDFSEQISQHVARRRMLAEIPNIEKQQAVMDADIALKGSQTADNIARTARSTFDLGQADRLKDISAEAAVQSLSNAKIQGRSMESQISVQEVDKLLKHSQIRASDQSIRESSQRIAESTDRIKTAHVQRDQTQVETEIKKIELQLRRLGINPNDPAWSRIMGRILDETGATDNIISESKQWQLPKFLGGKSGKSGASGGVIIPHRQSKR